MRKPVFAVSDHRLYNPRGWLETRNFGFRKERDYTIRVAKTKALISYKRTTDLCLGFRTCKNPVFSPRGLLT